MKRVTPSPVVETTATTGQPENGVEESPNAVAATLSEDNLRELAYRKWQAASCPDGNAMEYWLEAERELAAQSSPHDAK